MIKLLISCQRKGQVTRRKSNISTLCILFYQAGKQIFNNHEAKDEKKRRKEGERREKSQSDKFLILMIIPILR